MKRRVIEAGDGDQRLITLGVKDAAPWAAFRRNECRAWNTPVSQSALIRRQAFFKGLLVAGVEGTRRKLDGGNARRQRALSLSMTLALAVEKV